MALVVVSIYLAAVLFCVGTTALILRAWTRRRYWHKSRAICITWSQGRRCCWARELEWRSRHRSWWRSATRQHP